MTRTALVDKLNDLGFVVCEEMIHNPTPICVDYLKRNGLQPYLMVHPDTLCEYEHLDTSNPNAVVLGDAPQQFNYEMLNKAFQILINSQSHLITLGLG